MVWNILLAKVATTWQAFRLGITLPVRWQFYRKGSLLVYLLFQPNNANTRLYKPDHPTTPYARLALTCLV